MAPASSQVSMKADSTLQATRIPSFSSVFNILTGLEYPFRSDKGSPFMTKKQSQQTRGLEDRPNPTHDRPHDALVPSSKSGMSNVRKRSEVGNSPVSAYSAERIQYSKCEPEAVDQRTHIRLTI